MASLIDLSMPLADGLSTYPGGPKMAVINRITHDWSAPRYLSPAAGAADRILVLNEHLGTHVDAPFHFDKAGATIDAVDLGRFCGTAILADVSNRDPRQPVTEGQLEECLARQNETITPGEILIVRSWPGTPEDAGYHQATALAPLVGQWAVDRGLKAVGIDLPSVDSPGDRSFPVHMALVKAGILIYENLCNLSEVSRTRFTFFGLPLKLVGATGSPVRAVALLE